MPSHHHICLNTVIIGVSYDLFCEVRAILTFDRQFLISPSLSLRGHFCEILQNSLKVSLTYHIHENEIVGQPE